jgi:GNAT superfamily N-acetyltransferase
MKSLNIRNAEFADIPRIEEMCQRFLAETPYGTIVGECATPVLNGLIMQTMQRGIILLAEVDFNIPDPQGAPTDRYEGKQVVGFIAIFALMHPFAQVPYGDELAWWVEPEHRKGRVGYYLLRSAEDWARQAGLKMLKIVAPAANSPVGRFLAGRGFTEVETTYHKRLD